MALASAALWAWSRDKPVAAGVFIGLGTAAKLYPVFLLVPLAILAIRTRRYASAGWATVAAALSWMTVNLPFAIAYHDGWWAFYKFSADRPAERSSVWAIAQDPRRRRREPGRRDVLGAARRGSRARRRRRRCWSSCGWGCARR